MKINFLEKIIDKITVGLNYSKTNSPKISLKNKNGSNTSAYINGDLHITTAQPIAKKMAMLVPFFVVKDDINSGRFVVQFFIRNIFDETADDVFVKILTSNGYGKIMRHSGVWENGIFTFQGHAKCILPDYDVLMGEVAINNSKDKIDFRIEIGARNFRARSFNIRISAKNGEYLPY